MNMDILQKDFLKAIVFIFAFFLIVSVPAEPSLENDFSAAEELLPCPEGETLSVEDDAKAEALAKYGSFLALLASPRPEVKAEGAHRLFDALEKDPHSPFLLGLVQLSVMEDKDPLLKELKIRRLEKILEKNPSHLPLALFCARYFSSVKNDSKASLLLEKALDLQIEKNPENKELFPAGMILAGIFSKNGRFDKAEEICRKLEKLPKLTGTEKNILLCFMPELMVRAEEKASDETSFLFGWLTGSEKEKYREKYFDLLTRFFKEAFSNMDKAHPEQLADLILSREKRALPGFLNKLSDEKKKEPFIKRVIALDRTRKGSYPEAALLWQEILRCEENPSGHSFIRIFLAALYSRTGKLREAAALYQILKKDFPESELFPIMLSACYYDLGENEKAEKELLAMPHRSEGADQLLFLSFCHAKKYREASLLIIGMQKKALSEKRILKRPLAIQGALAIEKTKNCKALILFLAPYLKLNPNDVEIMNLLGYSLADAGTELALSEKLLMKAIALAPENMAIQDSVAWLCYRQGKYAEAKKWIEKALRSSPADMQDPVILDHAGDIFLKCGDKTSALKFWKSALGKKSEELDFELLKKKIRHHEIGQNGL